MSLTTKVRRAYWNRVLRKRDEVTFTFDGDLQLSSPPNNVSTRNTFVRGYKDPRVFRWMKAFLRPGMNALDVGANVGTYALFIAKRIGPSGKLIAVEPDPTNLRYLRQNVEANKLSQVAIEAAAAGAEAGTVDLLIHPTNRGEHRVAKDPDCDGTRVSVPLVRLDDLVSQHGMGKVDFIKIDIEGFEYWALRGLEETLRTQQPILVIEHSGEATTNYGVSTDDAKELLLAAGYKPFVLVSRRLRPYDFKEQFADVFWSKTPL